MLRAIVPAAIQFQIFGAALPGAATAAMWSVLGAAGGLNQNQQNVANGINDFFNGGGALPPAFLALFGLTGSNLAAGLTQGSGETATGSQPTTLHAMNLFLR